MKNITTYYIAVLFLMVGCGDRKSSDTESQTSSETTKTLITKEQFNTNGFLLGKLEKRMFPSIVETSGVIDLPPQNKAVVTSIMGGFVKKAPLIVGDEVKKGQMLVLLESQEFVKLQQEYLEVFNHLDFLKAEYERNKTLFEEKITSQKKYLEAKSNYEIQVARYRGIKKQLHMLNILPASVEKGIITSEVAVYSPIDGNVSKVNLATGSYVSPSTEMLEILNTEHLHLELTVFEKDILKVKKGQQIQFRIPEASEETFLAEVYLIGASIDETNRTINVHGHLENEDQNFLPGMFVDAKIFTDTHQGLSIPDQAILSSEDSFYLLKLVSENDENLVFEKIKIMPGNSFKGFTEVKSIPNSNPEDKFLVKGVFDLFGN